MKQTKLFALAMLVVAFTATTSCKKEECHECHYDVDGGTHSLGVKCDDDIKKLEKDGYFDAAHNATFEVHCHEH